MSVSTVESSTSSAAPRYSHKFGEELPVFCEKCGYSLHGLAQIRCEHCSILHFHCPECGHHQPINTLRPAAQTLLGRIRGGWLAMVIFFKIILFGWLLFFWVAMGSAWSYTYHFDTQIVNGTPRYNSTLGPAKVEWDSVLAFGLFALPFGMVLRMTLLRWKRGWMVGLVLATLVMLCIMIGVWLRRYERNGHAMAAYNSDFLQLMALAFVTIVLGAAIAWPIWTMLVHAFLPKRTAQALLNWQRSLSNDVSSLARN